MVDFSGEPDLFAEKVYSPEEPQPSGYRQKYNTEEEARATFAAPSASFEPLIRNGLTWSDNGLTMTELGRLSPDRLRELPVLDLRVMLAHLDSAAQAIQTELAER
jgi:hypothetical protein